jgi:uncharacterized Zn finger protein
MTPAKRSGVRLDRLRAMVSPAVWARGQDYAERRLVRLTSLAPDRVVARVEGSQTYRCTLEGKNLLEMACDCPAFEGFAGPCKHLVATALAVSRRSDDDPPPSAERIRQFLGGLPMEQLVELLVGLADADPDLEVRLLLRADAATAAPSELGSVLGQAIADAPDTGDFVDYREVADWAGRVDDLIDQLMATVRAGQAQAAVVLDLVPELIAGLEGAVEYTDDDGHIGMLLERSTDLLGAAALEAKPDPEAFGQLVAQLDLAGDLVEIGPPARALAEALGGDGLAAYWSSLQAEWAMLKPLRPAEDESRRRADHVDTRRWRLRERLVARARGQDDADAEIAILAKTLTGPHDYLALARACRDKGRLPEAVTWIDAALQLFDPQEQLDLAREGAPILAAAGQSDRALALLWAQFTCHPSLESYQDLQRLAGSAGAATSWRGRMLRWLDQSWRGELPEAEQPIHHGRWAVADAADVLVEIGLVEDDLARAWEVANASKISPGLWRSLAQASEAARPADSIRVYQTMAAQAVASGRKSGYREAVDLVRTIERLGHVTATNPPVDTWIAALRTKHKAKRSFIAMLDTVDP